MAGPTSKLARFRRYFLSPARGIPPLQAGHLIPLDARGLTMVGVDYRLERFVEAQEFGFDDVLVELRTGRKSSHWIWFIFPQIAGLGHSPVSQLYAITSLDEARAYLAHPVLGARLRECAGILLTIRDRSAAAILGPTDALKLRSCMTLFQRAAPDELVFGQVLDRFYDGVGDALTYARLGDSE